MLSAFLRIALQLLVTVLIVCALLATLPADAGTWLSRTEGFLATLLHGDFGFSFGEHAPVSEAVVAATGRTLAIIGSTAACLLAIGVPLGTLTATRDDLRALRVVRRIFDAVSGMPVLIWSTLMVVAFGRLKGIDLSSGPAWRAIVSATAALVIGDRLLADLTQRVELSTREVMKQPYMRTARAADLGYHRHLLIGLVRPVGTTLVSRSMFLIGGAIVVELVFGIHGLGYLVVAALNAPQQDANLILAASLALVAVGLLFRLIYALALVSTDPRARRA